MLAKRDGDDRELDLVRCYLDEIGSVPLLTAAQEVELAKRIEAGLYAAELLRQAGASLTERRRAELSAVAEDGRPPPTYAPSCAPHCPRRSKPPKPPAWCSSPAR